MSAVDITLPDMLSLSFESMLYLTLDNTFLLINVFINTLYIYKPT